MDFLVTQSFTLEHLRRNLKGLPKSPDEFYEKAMRRILNQEIHQNLATETLTWLVFCMRTISFKEVQHALAIQKGDKLFHTDRLVTAERLTAACAGIVLVDTEADSIRLAHYTAAEYLRVEKAELFQRGHSKLAERCLTYLNFDEFGQTTRPITPSQYPFLSYAADHWGDHMAQGVKEGHAQWLAWNLLSSGTKVENARRAMTEASFKPEAQLSGLHLAAYFGLETVVKRAISKGKSFSFNAETNFGETALHWAAKLDQVGFIKLLLEQRVDLNKKDNDGRTALLHAVMCRCESSVRVLLSSKQLLDLDAMDRHRWTPLRWAARYGPGRIVEMLLKHGASIDAEDDNGWTALRWAAYQSQTEIVQQLIKHDASTTQVSRKDRWTLMHWAAGEGRELIIEILIDSRLPLDNANHEGRSALHCAVDYNHSRTAWLLINAGADINVADKEGNTPLHLAVSRYKKSQDNSLVWLLLERGAKKTAKNNLGLAPSHIAAVSGYTSVLWLLLEKGEDVNAVDEKGNTMLHSAISGHHKQEANSLVPFLLERGAKKNAKNKLGLTPSHMAAIAGNGSVLRLLLERGADLTLVDNNERTPLHCAITEGQCDVIPLLLERAKILVFAQDDQDQTALHIAASEGNLGIVELLLRHRAGMDVCDRSGLTPLHQAVSRQHHEVVHYLVEKGADVNKSNKKGWTPLHSAAQANNILDIAAIVQSGNADLSLRNIDGQTAWDVGVEYGCDLRDLS